MYKINNLFLCVGAQKAGTSWLHHILKNHSDIEFTDFKEIHYFDKKYNINNILINRLIRGMAKIANVDSQEFEKTVFMNKSQAISSIGNLLDDSWYIRLFEHNAKYCADFTPEYGLLKEDAFRNIKNISNNQKIIFIMRDPVERALSAMQYFYRNKNLSIEDEPIELLMKKSLTPLFLERSKYQETISVLDKEFDTNNILYLFYEEVMKNKENSLEEISKFLDIPTPEVRENKLNKIVNRSSKFKFDEKITLNLEGSLKDTYEFIADYFGYLPEGWREIIK